MRDLPVTHPWLRERTTPVVLAVGRLVPQKDFGLLLAAFAEVRRHRPARLVVLGDGPLRADLEAQADRLGIAADVSLPAAVSCWYTRSSNSTRLFLKPVVFTLARLCATLSMFCCCAFIPLAAV